MSDVPTPDGLVFDADNHYYEAVDAFTRYLDPRLGRRIVQWAEIEGRKYQVIGGKVNHAVVNPTFDPIAKAGAMSEYFRGNASGRSPMEYLREREPIRPEYRDHDARLAHDGRAGRRQDLAVPDARCALRAGTRRRPRRRRDHVRRVQQVARGRLGLRVQEPHLRGALHLARRRRRRREAARVGARQGRAAHRHAPRGAEHAARAASSGVRWVRPVLGARERSRHHRRRARGRQRLLAERLRPRQLRVGLRRWLEQLRR